MHGHHPDAMPLAFRLPLGLDREGLADRLTASLLSEAGSADAAISEIVEQAMRAESRCP